MNLRISRMIPGKPNHRLMALALFSFTLAFFCLVPATTFAQVPVQECGAERGIFSVVPSQGPAGSAFSVSGSVMLSPTSRAFDAPESDPSIVMPGPDFEVWWVETDMAGAMLLGTMPSDYDTATMLASFSGSFMVPATSAPGQHQVAVLIVQGTTPACEDFTVTTTVQEDAYVLTATSLPASLPGTGLMLMAPVTGLLAVGAGGYVIRTRSRRR